MRLLIMACLIWATALGFCPAVWADDTTAPAAGAIPAIQDPQFSLDLNGGFIPLQTIDYNYNLKVFSEHEYKCNTDDDSHLKPNGVYGLSASYYPPTEWIKLGFITEALYSRQEGDLTGKIRCSKLVKRGYDYPQQLDFWQLNFLGRFFLSRQKVRPFVQAGLGILRIDSELDDYRQTSYGSTALISWGLEWRANEWFGLSGEARLSDHFGAVFFFEPSEVERATIETLYLPVSFIIKTQFFLF